MNTRSLDNHLQGVTADRPHPESYRPDLPLLTGPADDSLEVAFDVGYDAGYDDGDRAGYQRGVATRANSDRRASAMGEG